MGETPLPIPNRTVKTQTAYDTWLATARESEWLPELFFIMVGIAQLVRAPDCGSGGRGFESHYPPLLWVISSVGRALDF